MRLPTATRQMCVAYQSNQSNFTLNLQTATTSGDFRGEPKILGYVCVWHFYEPE